MPADFEYNIDHRMVDMAAWDHVSLDDLADCFERMDALPGNLSQSVQYLDLSEASALVISHTGALQLGTVYEKILNKGIRGLVIFAPAEQVAEKISMIISTLSDIIGPFPDGFHLVRAHMPASEVSGFIDERKQSAGLALSS